MENLTVFCDSIKSIAIHNGVARISFIRIGVDGKPETALELLLPVNQVAEMVKGLSTVANKPAGK